MGDWLTSHVRAAYRSGEKLFDNQEGRHYFYARSVMPESFILTPKNAPEWASNRDNYGMKLKRKIENQTHGMQKNLTWLYRLFMALCRLESENSCGLARFLACFCTSLIKPSCDPF